MLLAKSLPKRVKTRNMLVLLEDVATKHNVIICGARKREYRKLIFLDSSVQASLPKISGPIWANKEFCDMSLPQVGILNDKLYSQHILINPVKKIPWKSSPQVGTVGLFGDDFHQSRKIGSQYLSTNQYNIFRPLTHRFVHSSSVYLSKVSDGKEVETEAPSKPSSKVEEAVKAIEEKQKTAVIEPKRPILKRIQDELLHYYHGFRLLFIDIKISAKLLWRILRGNTLSRREHRQLVRTTSDVFRLLPFSVFIIVPFMEFLLPVFLKFFPGMLPSTFQTNNEKESKMKAELKVKLDMAKFLQQTLDEMAPQNKGRSSALAKDFSLFIEKIRTTGAEVSNDEIIKFSKLFEDEITLDSLSRPQLMALCRVLEISAFGNTTMLRFQLKMRLRNLLADDKVIQKEGVKTLTYQELQMACKARGMRALGVAEDRLRRQLEQWLQLSIHEKVPPSLLLLSRAMYLSEHLPDTAQLQATLSSLPEAAALQTKGAIGEREGRVDHKVRIEILKEEERRIHAEREELQVEAKKDEAPVEPPMSTLLGPDEPPMTVVQDIIESVLDRKVPMPDRVAQPEGVTPADLGIIENAIDNLGVEKKALYMEKEELEDLKEEIQEYSEDVEDLKTLTKKTPGEAVTVKESKGARLLFKKLNAMISQIDGEIKAKDTTQDSKVQLVATEELLNAIKVYQTDPDRLKTISGLLEQLDDNKDGKIDVDDVLKLVDLIGRENITLNQKQLEEVVALLNKEELLEEETKDKQKLIKNRSAGQSDPKGPTQ